MRGRARRRHSSGGERPFAAAALPPACGGVCTHLPDAAAHYIAAYTCEAVRSSRGAASTSQGHPYGILRRALKRRDLLGAVAAAKELPPLSLSDALELTILIARKDPRRHPRVAARWLLRYLEECDQATIDEAAMVASCLAALAGNCYQDAALSLRAMAERATSRRRSRGVA
jgi:hypothetical protein